MILLSYLILYCAFDFVHSQRPNIVVIVADDLVSTKGQIISKRFSVSSDSFKKRTKELFVRFLEESEDTKKSFRNYLTFRAPN